MNSDRPRGTPSSAVWPSQRRVPTARTALCSVAVALLGILAGCGQTGPKESSAPSQPADIALRYATDIYSMHAQEAGSLVLPASRNDFQVLANLMGAHDLSEHGLRVGATTITGNSAVVVILGSICTAPRGTTSSAETPTCVSNSDPRSSDPGFHVSLTKTSEGRWFVYFPTPKSG